MKKRISQLLAAGVAVGCAAAPMVATAVPAMAADPVKNTTTKAVTINASDAKNDLKDYKFTAYKVLDAYDIGTNGDDDTTALYNYQLTDAFKTLSTDHFEVNKDGDIVVKAGFTEDGKEYKVGDVMNLGDDTRNENTRTSANSLLASEIMKWANDNKIAGTEMTYNTASQLENGYYLIAETTDAKDEDGTVATKPILLNTVATTDASIDLTAKDAKVEISKTINDATKADSNTKEGQYSIGDTIPFMISSNFPIYENAVDATKVSFQVSDTLADGLTLKPGSSNANIKVNVGGAEVAAGTDTFSISESSDHQLTINFAKQYIVDHQGEAVNVTYNAMLNGNAVINGNTDNDAHVKYATNPQVNTHTDNISDKDSVYTYGFNLQKIDGKYLTGLAGATFQLRNKETNTDSKTTATDFQKTGDNIKLVKIADGHYRIATPDDVDTTTDITTTNGNVAIDGLESGTYTLHESKAPAGYAKAADVDFTVTGKQSASHAYDGTYGLKEDTASSSFTAVASGTTVADSDFADTASAEIVTTADNKVANLVVKDYKGVSLPETGATTAIMITAAGIAVVSAGIVMNRKKVVK